MNYSEYVESKSDALLIAGLSFLIGAAITGIALAIAMAQ